MPLNKKKKKTNQGKFTLVIEWPSQKLYEKASRHQHSSNERMMALERNVAQGHKDKNRSEKVKVLSTTEHNHECGGYRYLDTPHWCFDRISL